MKKLVIAIALIFTAHFASAAPLVSITVPGEVSGDVYFSPAGVDTGSCQSKGSPCKTPAYTMQRVTAGHNVWCATGTYALPSSITGTMSGSASSPIFFGPYSGQSCTFTHPSSGTMFDNVSYWSFHDATYKAINRGWVFGLTAGSATHIQFYKNTMMQTTNPDSFCGPANCGLIYLEPQQSSPDYFDIVQNEINSSGTGSSNPNNGGVMVFRTKHINIIGNTIHDTPDAIHFKFDHSGTDASQVSVVVANNIVWNADVDLESSWSQVFNNAFSNTGIILGNNAGVQGGKYSVFNNNTFHKTMLIIAPGGDSNCNTCSAKVTNSVFSGSTTHQQLQILPFVNGSVSFTHNYNYWPSNAAVLTNFDVVSLLSLALGITLETNGTIKTATYAGDISTTPRNPVNWGITNTVAGNNGLPMGAVAANLLTANPLGAAGSSPAPTVSSPPTAPSLLQVIPN